jgi:hypothetical protein
MCSQINQSDLKLIFCILRLFPLNTIRRIKIYFNEALCAGFLRKVNYFLKLSIKYLQTIFPSPFLLMMNVMMYNSNMKAEGIPTFLEVCVGMQPA